MRRGQEAARRFHEEPERSSDFLCLPDLEDFLFCLRKKKKERKKEKKRKRKKCFFVENESVQKMRVCRLSRRGLAPPNFIWK